MSIKHIVDTSNGRLFRPTVVTIASGPEAEQRLEELLGMPFPSIKSLWETLQTEGQSVLVENHAAAEATFAAARATAERALERGGPFYDGADARAILRAMANIDQCALRARELAAEGKADELAALVRWAALAGYRTGAAHRTEELLRFQAPAECGLKTMVEFRGRWVRVTDLERQILQYMADRKTVALNDLVKAAWDERYNSQNRSRYDTALSKLSAKLKGVSLRVRGGHVIVD